MDHGYNTILVGGEPREYRRFTDDRIFTVDDATQLPCDGPADCAYEILPGGDFVTVRPRGATAQSELVKQGITYAPTTLAAQRSFKDVLIEALSLGLMGGGAIAVGYGLGKEKLSVATIGALVFVAGAGLRLAVMIPFFERLKRGV